MWKMWIIREKLWFGSWSWFPILARWIGNQGCVLHCISFPPQISGDQNISSLACPSSYWTSAARALKSCCPVYAFGGYTFEEIQSLLRVRSVWGGIPLEGSLSVCMGECVKFPRHCSWPGTCFYVIIGNVLSGRQESGIPHLPPFSGSLKRGFSGSCVVLLSK